MYYPLPKEDGITHTAKMQALDKRIALMPLAPRWKGDAPHPRNFEQLVSKALSDTLMERDKKRLTNRAKKDLASRLVWVMPDGTLMQSKMAPAEVLKIWKPQVMQKNPGARMLNDMPFDEALPLLVKFAE
jgi:hypothetical protein